MRARQALLALAKGAKALTQVPLAGNTPGFDTSALQQALEANAARGRMLRDAATLFLANDDPSILRAMFAQT